VADPISTRKKVADPISAEDKSIPYGREGWVSKVVKKYGIEQVLRGVGRPKKGG
jgi:hypothetical protein